MFRVSQDLFKTRLRVRRKLAELDEALAAQLIQQPEDPLLGEVLLRGSLNAGLGVRGTGRKAHDEMAQVPGHIGDHPLPIDVTCSETRAQAGGQHVAVAQLDRAVQRANRPVIGDNHRDMVEARRQAVFEQQPQPFDFRVREVWRLGARNPCRQAVQNHIRPPHADRLKVLGGELLKCRFPDPRFGLLHQRLKPLTRRRASQRIGKCRAGSAFPRIQVELGHREAHQRLKMLQVLIRRGEGLRPPVVLFFEHKLPIMKDHELHVSAAHVQADHGAPSVGQPLLQFAKAVGRDRAAFLLLQCLDRQVHRAKTLAKALGQGIIGSQLGCQMEAHRHHPHLLTGPLDKLPPRGAVRDPTEDHHIKWRHRQREVAQLLGQRDLQPPLVVHGGQRRRNGPVPPLPPCPQRRTHFAQHRRQPRRRVRGLDIDAADAKRQLAAVEVQQQESREPFALGIRQGRRIRHPRLLLKHRAARAAAEGAHQADGPGRVAIHPSCDLAP